MFPLNHICLATYTSYTTTNVANRCLHPLVSTRTAEVIATKELAHKRSVRKRCIAFNDGVPKQNSKPCEATLIYLRPALQVVTCIWSKTFQLTNQIKGQNERKRNFYLKNRFDC
jgi:hypothetical protein